MLHAYNLVQLSRRWCAGGHRVHLHAPLPQHALKPSPLCGSNDVQVAIVFISMHLFFSMGSAKGAAAGGLSPPGKDARGQRPPQLAVRVPWDMARGIPSDLCLFQGVG